VLKTVLAAKLFAATVLSMSFQTPPGDEEGVKVGKRKVKGNKKERSNFRSFFI